MKAKLAVTDSELKHLLSEAAFTKTYGFMLHSMGDGECILDVPFQEKFERPGGIISGPVFMAVADTAMWLAIITKLGIADMSVTTEMKTAFLSTAKQEDIRCIAKILKLGKHLVYGVAECVNGEGKLLTHHTITYMRLVLQPHLTELTESRLSRVRLS
jgi:uncharacterized protein (TIGR00369 family)